MESHLAIKSTGTFIPIKPPYLVAGNRARLERGAVHSVEPGVYLPGRWGVRLEDLVVVDGAGGRTLNHAPRDLRPPRLRR